MKLLISALVFLALSFSPLAQSKSSKIGATAPARPSRSPKSTAPADRIDQCRRLTDRFNRLFAMRFPFGPLDSQDAKISDVQSFFKDYDTDRSPCTDLTDELRVFAASLSQAADFFLAAQTLSLSVKFNMFPQQSVGADQIAQWRFRSGTTEASYPNTNTQNLIWTFSDPVTLDLVWADQSTQRPQNSPNIPDLLVNGATASFSGSFGWALLRLIQAHRMNTQSTGDAIDLEFNIPNSSPGTTRVYVEILPSVKIPTKFLRFAPSSWGGR